MKIGVLTGGGDCPGLNAVIRAILRKGTIHYEDGFVGFVEGWRGLLEDKTMELDLSSVGGVSPWGNDPSHLAHQSRETCGRFAALRREPQEARVRSVDRHWWR